MKEYNIHLVSDATGETVVKLAAACTAQFDGIKFVRHTWTMIRTPARLEQVLDAIAEDPGIVLCTLVDPAMCARLIEECNVLQVPCIPLMDPIIRTMANYVGQEAKNMPGRQHTMDSEYFSRIDAMNFALSHDDGQSAWTLDEADVIVLGVSRTSKTPTCIYLANRGVKAANIPVVPNCPLPRELDRLKGPLIVGLTKDPQNLIHVRRNRLRMLNQGDDTDYINPETVQEEVQQARKLFTKNGWPVIDVTRKSIEETASMILRLYNNQHSQES